MTEWPPPGTCIIAEQQKYGYRHVHGRDCDVPAQVWAERVPWTMRTMTRSFDGTWWPYLFEGWHAMASLRVAGRTIRIPAGGFRLTKRGCEKYIAANLAEMQETLRQGEVP